MAGPLPEWLVKLVHPSKGFVKEISILPTWMAGCVPSASPLSVVSTIVAHRGSRLVILWALPALLLAAAAVFRGRVFCAWMCPVGTLHHVARTGGHGRHFLKVRFSGYIFWMIVFSSGVGFPVLLFLDPLSVFARANLPFEGAMTLASLVPGLVLPAILLAGLVQPLIWCAKCCPLGYLFDLLHRTHKGYAEKFRHDRRELLVGALVGLPLAAVAKTVLGKDPDPPLLPPGAGSASEYSALCHRCYACVNVCPTRILTVEFPGNTVLGRWFEPEMNPYKGTCLESCNNCARVCPNGAIRHLTLAEKRNVQLGVAEVFKTKCVGWLEKDYCMVCDEFCPYRAIMSEVGEKGLPRPVVDPEKCRGCGICQNACPVKDGGAAIVVKPLRKQRTLL